MPNKIIPFIGETLGAKWYGEDEPLPLLEPGRVPKEFTDALEEIEITEEDERRGVKIHFGTKQGTRIFRKFIKRTDGQWEYVGSAFFHPGKVDILGTPPTDAEIQEVFRKTIYKIVGASRDVLLSECQAQEDGGPPSVVMSKKTGELLTMDEAEELLIDAIKTTYRILTTQEFPEGMDAVDWMLGEEGI